MQALIAEAERTLAILALNLIELRPERKILASQAKKASTAPTKLLVIEFFNVLASERD
jgi:hypothetical protein